MRGCSRNMVFLSALVVVVSQRADPLGYGVVESSRIALAGLVFLNEVSEPVAVSFVDDHVSEVSGSDPVLVFIDGIELFG